jgi:hypothetical protein
MPEDRKEGDSEESPERAARKAAKQPDPEGTSSHA